MCPARRLSGVTAPILSLRQGRIARMLDRRIPPVVAVLAVGTAGCGGVTSSTASSKSPLGTKVSGSQVTVSMTEFRFGPKALSAKAGKLRVRAKNAGHMQHEFVLIRTKKAPGALPTKGEEASEAGAVGEIREQKPGKSG